MTHKLAIAASLLGMLWGGGALAQEALPTQLPPLVTFDAPVVALLNEAVTLQVVVDICDVELSDEQTDGLETAKHFFRGRLGLTRAQVDDMRDRVEADIRSRRAGYCAGEGRRDIQGRMKRTLDAAE